jgi:hypothetical protein
VETQFGGSYFFVNESTNETVFKHLIASRLPRINAVNIILAKSFAPWPIPDVNLKAILTEMKNKKIKTCSIYLICKDEEAAVLMCEIPFVEELYCYMTKNIA